MLIKSLSLSATLTVALLGVTLTPAFAGGRRAKPFRSNTPICFIKLPNQPVINLQSLCGASGTSGRNTTPAVVGVPSGNLAPGAASALPTAPGPGATASVPASLDPPTMSQEPTNQPDEAIISNEGAVPNPETPNRNSTTTSSTTSQSSGQSSQSE